MLHYLLILLAFAADRVSKAWAEATLAGQDPIRVNSLLTLRRSYNSGIAFGMLQGIGPAVGWLSVAIIAGLFVFLVRAPRAMRLQRAGLALIIGGALGNLVDRLTAGQVLDFIMSPLRPGIFNVADLTINLGMFLAVMGTLATGRRAGQEERAATAAENRLP